ncbi:MAG: peroxiredoxin family protein [Cellvibrionaceae bacterium]
MKLFYFEHSNLHLLNYSVVLCRSIFLTITFIAGINLANAESKSAIKLPPKNMVVPLAITTSEKLGKSDEGIGLKIGETFNSFSIKTHDGKPINSSDLLEKSPLLIVFYRGGWCPYCNLQIRQLTEAYPNFKKRNVTPVLISVDATDGAALAQKTYNIPFPVLSDSNLLAHNAFNVMLKVDNKTTAQYKEYGIDLEAWSSKDHHSIAISSVFLVDKNGKVLWAHASKDYKTRPSPAQLLDVIDHTLRK